MVAGEWIAQEWTCASPLAMTYPKSGVWPVPAANEEQLLALMRKNATLRQMGLYPVHPDMADQQEDAGGRQADLVH
jgi:hypothetical protein